ncbi:hypothetical protein OROMI_007124 [Orobanche minor]
MKLEYALVAMEGSALHWLQWIMRRLPTLSWRRFTVELLKQYGDDPRTNPYIRVRIRSKDAVIISTTMHLAREIERELAYQLQDFPPPAPVPPFFANRPAVQQGYPRSNAIVAAKTTPSGLMSSHDTVNHSEAAPLGQKLGGQNLTESAGSSTNHGSQHSCHRSQSE